MPSSDDSPDIQRLRSLALDKCSGALSDEGVSELSEILSSSARARREYLEITTVYAKLKWELGRESARNDELTELASAYAESEKRRSRLVRPSGLLLWSVAIAACLLLVVTLGDWRWGDRGAQPHGDAVAGHSDRQAVLEPLVGAVKPLVEQSNWSFGRPGGLRSRDFHQGDTISVEDGEVELRLLNGTVAVLRAPVVMRVVSQERVSVLRGSIKVDVAQGAEGFTVETASAEVIDLGTVFSVGVENGETDVVVFEGKVDLKVRDPSRRDDQTKRSVYKRFRAGEAVHVSGDGTLSRIVNVTSTNFGAGDGSPPLITSVKDNIVRPETWDFYEIVPSGMGEDQQAYVDRPHQWNGATSQGMPDYLVSGDYVKTFCNDKITTDIRIEVALSRPAVLFVLFDKRLAPPDWLVRSFEPTGDDIGIDETDFDVWKQEPTGRDDLEVGPGKGIERRFSVWRKVVKDAGVVPLGPNGVPISEIESLDLNAKMAMYGVVAVPLEKVE